VTATISNTGRVAGSDVVQCYLGPPESTGEPSRQLRGFQRVTLAPGRSTTVRLHLTPGDLAQWSTAANSWVIAPGTYRISVGDGSDRAHLPLSATVTVAGAILGVNSGPAPNAS
jgi:beta-glucosidase